MDSVVISRNKKGNITADLDKIAALFIF